MSTEPAALVDFVTVPQWVAWRNEMRNGKITKVPYCSATRQAEADDASTWLPHDQAVLIADAVVNGSGGGIGIELGQCGEAWIAGVDLDSCRDPVSGIVEPWASAVIDRLGSYTEVSPSETGVKVFFLADPSDMPKLRHIMGTAHGRQFKRANGSSHPPSIELYLSNRYFTVTWEGLADAPAELRVVPLADLRWLIEEAGPAFSGKRDSANGSAATNDTSASILDRLDIATKHSKPLAAALLHASTMRGGSRSEGAFGLGAALKRAGWTFEDMKAALRACPVTQDWAGAADERQFKRVWARSDDGRNGATPPTGWRPVAPEEVFELGRHFRMNQTTGVSEVYEPPGGAPAAAPEESDPKQSKRGTQHGRLLVLGMDDLDTSPPRDYLLKGIISPNETSIWVGPPKCGKSFLLMYVAYKLALGQRVFGLRVKPTKVLYVAAEGEGGIAKRLQALRSRYGRAENFHYIAQPIDLMRDGGHSQEVITAANAVDAQLIIVDTLNRALAGGNENAPDDMGAFICNVAEIRTRTRAHIAVIHHGTKASDGRNPRGHGSLEGADDALIGVQKLDGGIRTATLVHSKDDADGMVWAFKLDVVELGTDDDGDPITTLIVQETTEAPAKAAKAPALSNNEQIALACFDKAMKAEGILGTVGDNHEERPVLQELAFRRWYYQEAKPGETQEVKRQAFKRAVDGLLAKGRLACRDDLFWRPDTW